MRRCPRTDAISREGKRCYVCVTTAELTLEPLGREVKGRYASDAEVISVRSER
jgi:hypothetical protein